MAQAVTRIKKRIKAIKGSYKITSAMKLVSSVKLKKWKGKMLAFKEYAQQIDELSSLVFSYVSPKNEPYFKPNEAQKNLYIILSSSLGLCGSYNASIFRLADSIIKPEDDVIYSAKSYQPLSNFNLQQDLHFQKLLFCSR